MVRLIDKDVLTLKGCHVTNKDGSTTIKAAVMEEDLDEAPTIDAIPISFIEEQVKLCSEIGFRRGEECYVALIEKWREKNAMPTIDALPERTGTWTEEYDPDADLFFRRRYRCSACNGWNTYGFTTYCPQCGAWMVNSTAVMMAKKKETDDAETD